MNFFEFSPRPPLSFSLLLFASPPRPCWLAGCFQVSPLLLIPIVLAHAPSARPILFSVGLRPNSVPLSDVSVGLGSCEDLAPAIPPFASLCLHVDQTFFRSQSVLGRSPVLLCLVPNCRIVSQTLQFRLDGIPCIVHSDRAATSLYVFTVGAFRAGFVIRV